MNDLDTTIRTLDPATGDGAHGRDDVQRRRADALLERIVAQDPSEAAPTNAPRGRRRAWGIGGVAAGAAAASIAIALTLVPQGPSAVASWTPEASPVSAADLALAETACRSQLTYVDGIGEMPLVLSERRGDVVGLLFWRAMPDTASSCVVDLPVGATSVGDVRSGSGGSSGPAYVPPPNQFIEGSISQFTLDGGTLSLVNGGVGDGIVGITVHAGSTAAEATISEGRFSIWMPAAAFTATDQPSGQGGPEVTLTYDITLADGTVIMNATSALPE